MNFEEALNTGKVLIRRVFKGNTFAKTGNYSVQFIQQKGSGSANGLLSELLGNPNFGKTKPTGIMTIVPDVLKKFGLEEKMYTEGDAVFAEEVFGKEHLAIHVTENTEKNPKAPNQRFKINPTSKAVLLKDGKEIYRHTVVTDQKLEDTFIIPDDSRALTAQEAVEYGVQVVGENVEAKMVGEKQN